MHPFHRTTIALAACLPALLGAAGAAAQGASSERLECGGSIAVSVVVQRGGAPTRYSAQISDRTDAPGSRRYRVQWTAPAGTPAWVVAQPPAELVMAAGSRQRVLVATERRPDGLAQASMDPQSVLAALRITCPR